VAPPRLKRRRRWRDRFARGPVDPSTVRDRLLPQVEEAGINYLLGRLAFGNLALERSLRSVELLEEEVIPALAGAGALRSG